MKHVFAIYLCIGLLFGCAYTHLQETVATSSYPTKPDPCLILPAPIFVRYVNMPKESPKDFAIEMMFGHHYIINTFKGTLSKSTNGDSLITIPFQFSQIVKDSIYSKMLAIDFFNIPSNWQIDDRIHYRCWEEFHFMVRADSVLKYISLMPKDSIYCEQNKALKEVENFILRHIYSSEEYKKLPKSTGLPL